jgi:hypothetical protein
LNAAFSTIEKARLSISSFNIKEGRTETPDAIDMVGSKLKDPITEKTDREEKLWRPQAGNRELASYRLF